MRVDSKIDWGALYRGAEAIALVDEQAPDSETLELVLSGFESYALEKALQIWRAGHPDMYKAELAAISAGHEVASGPKSAFERRIGPTHLRLSHADWARASRDAWGTIANTVLARTGVALI
jgi:hypothetical protein